MAGVIIELREIDRAGDGDCQHALVVRDVTDRLLNDRMKSEGMKGKKKIRCVEVSEIFVYVNNGHVNIKLQ